VGFIKKLPHQLIESFKSTLQEVSGADLLLHVVDCADPLYNERIRQTREVLKEIGAGDIKCLMVYNKIDANPEFDTPIENGYKRFPVSALNKTGISALQAELIAIAGKSAGKHGDG
jgi:GTP-binding protein HflX